jgi:DNA-3-methyladenine glycosylase
LTNINLVLDSGERVKGKPLPQSFFDKPSPMVAWDVLGKVLIHQTPKGVIAGKIVETEAYLGEKDPACHASAGDTARNKIFLCGPGTVYVFSSFGIYNCLNVLTSGEDPAGCVLLRALEPLVGIDVMQRNRGTKDPRQLTSGPGKLTDALNVSREFNGRSITDGPLMIADCGFNSFTPCVDVRVGITKATQYPFRYYVPNNLYVSRQRQRVLDES